MLESKIDDLYRKPPDEFIPARAALASELKGDDAKRVKALKKPTIVPWAVNQVYWHARPIFDDVLRSGADLRRAQIAALEGRKADVHGASDAHRKAIASAVDRAMTLAGAAQVTPNRDAVARTFEALSLASAPHESPGRLTQPLQPGGFELLAGVEPVIRSAPMKGVPDTPVSRATPTKSTSDTHRAGDALTHRGGDGLKTVPTQGSKPAAKIDTRRAAEERAAAAQRAAAERKRERAHAAAVRRHEAAIAKLEGELERAKKEAARARVAWDRATDAVSAAERRLSEVRATRPPSLFTRT
jgi:hypothetical protein